jgi:hypothetical protein
MDMYFTLSIPLKVNHDWLSAEPVALLFYPFGTRVLNLIQTNHQPDATIFQFIIPTFLYRSICFGLISAHHQEHND